MIKIKRIDVRNCGPIKKMNIELDLLNLIYGHNESGKSFLIEFIIKKLFRNSKEWGYLRENSGEGIVYVEIDNKILRFDSKKHLEDFIGDYPKDSMKLFVVKSGEVEILNNVAGGINKKFIKSILSQNRILDKIDNEENISSTIKSAELLNEGIKINRQGIGKEYENLKKDFENIQKKIEEFIKDFDQGEISLLELKEKELEEKKNRLIRAKLYNAFLLSERIKELERELERYPLDKIEEIEKMILELNDLKKEIKNNEEKLKEIMMRTLKLGELQEEKERLLLAKRHLAYKYSKELMEKMEELKKYPEDVINNIQNNMVELRSDRTKLNKIKEEIEVMKERCKNLGWLEVARNNYYNLTFRPDSLSKIIFIIYLIIGFIILILVVFSKMWIIPFLLFIFLLITGMFFYSFQWNLFRKEMKNLKKEFKERFGIELKSINNIDELISKEREAYSVLDIKMKEKNELENRISSSEEKIKTYLGILSMNSEIDKLEIFLKDIKKKREDLNEEILRLKNEISNLGVQEYEYIKEEQDIKFNKDRLEEINSEIKSMIFIKEEEALIKNRIKDLEKKLNGIVKKIKEGFSYILKCEIDEEEWERKIKEIRMKHRKISEEINRLNGELKGLGVSEKDYIREKQDIDFSQEDFDNVLKQIDEMKKKIEGKRDDIMNLKSKITSITGDEISSNWEKVIKNLFKKRDEILKELKDIETEIIGKLLVHKTIEELRREEDERIIEDLNSQEIKESIFNTTRRYKELTIEGEDIKIRDDYNEFYLKDISTGAKEQVMLGLRIGFIKRIFGVDKGFLILDDAFQHSDWEKRPFLIETLINLAKNNWQIIYLTMDNNIKDTFIDMVRSKNFSLFKYFPIDYD
uniref:Rad50/SbcC-type AAA domain-containing protein n=1 Tax=candidate division WOR-3 bacterium TaxID=2052148 RepID=A0A7C4UFA3_UNCW3